MPNEGRESRIADIGADGVVTSRLAPLRGTQSFVTVMGLVWRRPGLTAIDAAWRWTAGLPFLVTMAVAVAQALRTVHPDVSALQAMTVFQPVAALDTLRRQLDPLIPPLWTSLRWLVPAAFFVWVAAAALGRRATWQRLDGSLRAPLGTLLVLGGLRLLLLIGFYALWLAGAAAAGRLTITRPAQHGAEPKLVFLSALLVGLTLLLFLLWCVTVWPLDVAPLLCMTRGDGIPAALGGALRQRELRAKLIEINLVMGIVKVGLLVLAMVFCATPLPFASEESTSFLLTWWSLMSLLFLLALDLFHVVRRAACLAFFRALVPPGADTTVLPRAAS